MTIPRTRFVFVLAFALASVASAVGPPPSETCTDADLSGTDMFNWSDFVGISSNDFTLPGPSCTELGIDAAVCFTPTSGCTVEIFCEFDSGSQSINVFTGPCTLTPASCTHTTAATAFPSLTGVVLTGGVNTCVVCEHTSVGSGASTITINQTAGDCGALPVGLLSFGIESSQDEASTGEGSEE